MRFVLIGTYNEIGCWHSALLLDYETLIKNLFGKDLVLDIINGLG